MKWFFFLALLCVSFSLLFPCVALTDTDKPIVIQDITHTSDSNTQETITIKLSAPVEPKIFILRGEKPRLVIDLPLTVYRGSSVISLQEGILASAVRLGLHQNPAVRTRAVVDLSREMIVQYKDEYLKEQNILRVTLTVEASELKKSTELTEVKEPEAVQPAVVVEVPAVESVPELKSEIKKEFIAQNLKENKPVTEEATQQIEVIEDKVKEQVAVEKQEAVEPTILEISFDDSSSKGEMVLFRLNDFYPPTVAAIETGSPRVLCDFSAMAMGPNVEENIQVDGKYISRIRTARHKNPDKVRVVLDLTPDRDYDLQQVFFRNDNLFVLIVNESPQVEASE